jgi:hypothetical protein
VRLVRTGSQIEALQSVDGATWTSIGVDAIPMAETVYVGIATTSHSAGMATDAVLDMLTITPVGAPTNQLPQVALTSPADGTAFTAGNDVMVSAGANDADGTISRVEFFAGSMSIGVATAAPFSATWQAAPAGTYSLTAVGAATSTAASIRVDPAPNQPPQVGLTSPTDGTTVTAGSDIALSASASDADGTVARVEFYVGTSLLNTDTTAPYTFTWSSVPAGTYAVRAVAYDDSGASATSGTSTITVSSTTTSAPTGVAFQASVDHATLVTGYELRIFASGADPAAATPIATSDLGKPAPDGTGDISVDLASFFSGLAQGSYIAAVSAIGSGGTSTSAGVPFTR